MDIVYINDFFFQFNIPNKFRFIEVIKHFEIAERDYKDLHSPTHNITKHLASAINQSCCVNSGSEIGLHSPLFT